MGLKLKQIARPIYLRYILLNIPGLAAVILILIIIQYWFVLPVWLFWSVIVFWIIKDAVLFPFVWRAYDPDSPALTNRMEGARGIAIEDLHPTGYVEIGAERWQAEVIGGGPSIRRGQRVKVHGIRGLTLLVQLDTES